MSNFYAVVTRHLPSHHTPVISTVIPAAEEPKDAERDYSGSSIPPWLEFHFKEAGQKHKDAFCEQLVEFRNARWMLEVVEVPGTFTKKLPHVVMSVEL